MSTRHSFEYNCDGSGDVIEHSTDSVLCSDVVRSMYYYLLGCSFDKQSIIDAMDTIVQEYGEQDDIE